ncbi:MAG: TIGR03545 family protein [Treponema sp.]|nr:TIGR03545 family protein [Treponema sp.]
MANKAPGFFKKSIKKDELQNDYLRYLEHESDQSFLNTVYAEQDGAFVLRAELEKDEVKHLKKLAKVIKKNKKGAFNFLPIVVVAILIAGIVFFFTVLLNPLLQKAMETGLEAAFEAKVDTVNFRADLFNFSISMDGLAIADRDSPMQNLIQFSRIAVHLKPAAVLRGKIYIEELRADSIRFATARTVSGALPDKPPKVKKEKSKTEFPPLVDLQNFDAMALLNREYDKLQTPKLYDAAIKAYNDSAAKWNAQFDTAKNRYTDLENRAKPLLALNINDYQINDVKTLEQTITRIQGVINDINSLVNSVQDAGNEINGMVTGVQQDLQTAAGLQENARKAFNGDLDYLKSYLDLSSGPAAGILDSVIGDILTDTAQTYLGYGERALEILQKVKEIQAKLPKSDKPVKVKNEKFRGRNVAFPLTQYPQFYLGVLAADVFTPNNWHWNFDLRGVSSDPDISGTPVNLVLSMDEGSNGRKASFNGMADFRTGIVKIFDTALTGSGFPVSLGSQLSAAGIGGYTGNMSFTANLAGDSASSFAGGGSLSLAQSKLTDPGNTFAQAVGTAIEGVPSLDVGVRFDHSQTGDSFDVNTNIGDLVMQALKDIANQYINKAAAEIEKMLRDRISSYVDQSLISSEELDAIFAAARGDKAAVDKLMGSLDARKNEFEQKLKQAADEVINQAADEAKRQAEQAAKDLLQGNTPSIQLPSTPSLPGTVPGAIPGNLFNR